LAHHLGTYGSRLHGDERPAVDRDHNVYETSFLEPDSLRNAEERAVMFAPEVRFAREQQVFIESIISQICVRGGRELVACAACPDHVHALLDIKSEIHSKPARF